MTEKIFHDQSQRKNNAGPPVHQSDPYPNEPTEAVSIDYCYLLFFFSYQFSLLNLKSSFFLLRRL